MFEDALHYFKLKSFVTKHLKITFLSEPAVDAGGPIKEFFYILLQEIARNRSLFHGDETSLFPVHNMFEISKNTFYYIGCMFAASIIHGGPGPCFLANSAADYILYGKLNACIYDVFDVSIKEKLIKVNTVLFHILIYYYSYLKHMILNNFVHFWIVLIMNFVMNVASVNQLIVLILVSVSLL